MNRIRGRYEPATRFPRRPRKLSAPPCGRRPSFCRAGRSGFLHDVFDDGAAIKDHMVADLSPCDALDRPDGEVDHASKAAVRSLSGSLQKGEAASNVRAINIAPGFVKTSIHVDMGISFEAYCEQLGNPDFISAEELADIILFCWKQPQRICDIVVMPTTSSFA